MTAASIETHRQEPPSSQERDDGNPGLGPVNSTERASPTTRATSTLLSASDGVGSMPDQVRGLFNSSSVQGSGMVPSSRRQGPMSRSTVGQVLGLRDIIATTVERLERLARGARPVHPHARRYEPVAGYHRWDPEELLRILAREAKRLARVAEELSADEALPVEVRLGMESIAGEILQQVLHYANQELGEAELARRT